MIRTSRPGWREHFFRGRNHPRWRHRRGYGQRGNMTVLRPGTNGWVCMPGVEIGQADMCADPMGMQWFTDLVVRRKPKPTNTAPGLIYMLNGATQHSYTDPFDRTSPPIPIGPHWMLIWPFDAEASRTINGHARRGNDDHVRRNAVCTPAHLRRSMGGQRISPWGQSRVDDDVRPAGVAALQCR